MKALARAVVNAVVYLDLSGEEGLNGETALQALEEISYNLSYCTEDEKKALTEVLTEMREAEIENGPRPDVIELLDNFLASIGLDEEEEADLEPPERINLL